MDIKISIELKDKYYGFSDLLDGRELNNQTKEEIIELIKEDIGYAFDQQIEVEAINYTRCSTDLPTSTQLLSDCKKRFKELEGKGNLDYRSYRNGYLDSFSKNVVSKIK